MLSTQFCSKCVSNSIFRPEMSAFKLEVYVYGSDVDYLPSNISVKKY